MNPRRSFAVLLVVCALALTQLSALAQRRGGLNAPRPAAPGGAGAAGGNVNLPYSANDSVGNQWLFYQGGWMQQRGNQPIYSQSAMLQINNNGVQHNANTARLDEKTGEIIFENMNPNVPGLMITRRILIEQKEGYLRYIDIIHNSSPQEQSIQYQLQTNLNYGISAANYVNEPAGKQRAIGWAAQTPAGRGAAELFAGRGAKVVPTFNWQQNSNFLQAQMQLTIPANKDVAVMHIHSTSATPEQGVAMMLGLKEQKLLAGVSAELRKAIVNFTSGMGYLGDREILRGDVLDVIELRGGALDGAGGDQLKGTLKENTLKLATFYGDITLAADKVIGLINVGQFRPRQLLISSDGEVFGGRLSKDTIEMELSSGQTTQVPLNQISRIGWRKRPGESDEPTTQPDRPILTLRSGDRIAVDVPDHPIDVATRYGLLKLVPRSVAAVSFASEESGVHQIFLSDGSRFAGLVGGEQFQFKLIGGAGGQTVSVPASSLARLQIAGAIEEPDDTAPSLALSNDDLLVGTLVGTLKLDTAFDTLSVNAPEIRALTRNKDGGGSDVQIELWDQSRLSGQLQQQELSIALASGITIKVPVMMVEQYNQPTPQPSAAMVERIKEVVGELGADDWKQRERAESQLVSMGTGVISVLKQMRGTVGPEAQQRIDSVVRQLDAKRKSKSSNAPEIMQPMDE